MIDHRIAIRDGKIFVRYGYGLSDEPKIRFFFYPTGLRERVARDYGIQDGEPLEPDGRDHGKYFLPEHRKVGGGYLTVQLVNGGATTAEHVEEVSVPAPKVRKNVEIRWRSSGGSGRWEKYLKTRGWVPA